MAIKLLSWRSFSSPWRALWSLVWDLAEAYHLSLGRFGPTCFGWALGARRVKAPKTVRAARAALAEKK